VNDNHTISEHEAARPDGRMHHVSHYLPINSAVCPKGMIDLGFTMHEAVCVTGWAVDDTPLNAGYTKN
jgi:hypothetical protein